MHTALRIFWRDARRILKNPMAVVVALGVCVIPSLYAWFNILANWDPYENTSTVPIAVVIEDRGANIKNLGQTNAGSMIRERLEDNDQLGWTFVDSEDEAREGVSAGTYYAAFVVPEDFTESLADVLDGNTDKAHISYYVNEKANAVAPKVTDTGATTLESQIENQFVSVVGKTVAEKLQGAVADAAAQADDATASVTADLREVQGQLGQLADDLDAAQATIASTREAGEAARSTLGELSSAALRMTAALEGGMDQLGSARTGVAALTSKLGTSLGSAAGSVGSISSTASYNIGQLTANIGWAQGKVDAAIAQIRALNGTTQTLRVTLEHTRTVIAGLTLKNGTSIEGQTQITQSLDTQISHLVELSDAQLAQLDRLEAVSTAIKSGADAVEGLSDGVNSAVQAGVQSLTDLQASLSATTVPQLSGALDTFADVGGRVTGAASGLPGMLDQASATLEQLDGVLGQASDTLSTTVGTVRGAADSVGGLADDAAAVESAATLAGVSDVLSIDAEEFGSVLGAPAELANEPVFSVANYGSNVTPFYTNLALWVGGFVLVAIYKLEVDDQGIGHFSPAQGFFGRWLLLAVLGELQALICCVGDLALGIQCVSPAAFVGAGLLQSFVYVFFIYAMSVAFKHIGKALCVVLVVMQIPGAAGLYPIEMMPGFFQALQPWLPFTYGIRAMREAIGGFYGSYYLQNMLMLLVYLVPALLIGVAARRRLLNVNALFDRELAATDLLIAERTGLEGARLSSTDIARALVQTPEHRAATLARTRRFEAAYPALVRGGFVALVVVPLVLLALLFVLPAKFGLLVCWIVSLVAICGYLIVLEYFHERVAPSVRLASMSREELHGLLDADGEKGGAAAAGTGFSPAGTPASADPHATNGKGGDAQ